MPNQFLVCFHRTKFAYALWLVRFSALLSYYVLLFTAAFMPIYSADPGSLYFVFVTIMVLSAWFLVLEFLSWRGLMRARKLDIYTYVDLPALRYFG